MPRTSRRPRLRGVSIRPGSIRCARLEAGLSLAELAAGHVTRSAIHQVETGVVRPSRPTLELIARRTGKPLDYFLVPSPGTRTIAPSPLVKAIAGLERLVLTDELEAARRQGRLLLSQVTEPAEEAEVRFWLGQAESRAAQSAAGLPNLRRARELFESLGDRRMIVECLDWEAASLYAIEDPGALALAEEALRRCAELKPVPVHARIRILTHLASIHVSRHEWEASASRYQEALEASESLKDLKSIARLYDCLSQTRDEQGDVAGALALSQKALSLHRSMGDQAAMARTENNLGSMLIKQGDLRRAEEYLMSALERCHEIGLERGRAHVLLSLAELRARVGEYDHAHRFANDAIEFAARFHERMTQALGHETLGWLATRQKDLAATRTQFELAVGLLSQGPRQRLLECHYAFARALEELGDAPGAMAQLKLAIASIRPDLADLGSLRQAL